MFSGLELAETKLGVPEAIPIRPISFPAGQMKCSSVQALQRLKQRTVFLDQQPLRQMQLMVRVDADQMRVEGGPHLVLAR